jgi:hypothetical protein
MTALVILEGVVIAILAVLVVGLLRSHAEILRELHQLGATDQGHRAHPPESHVRTEITKPRAGSIRVSDIAGATPTGGAVAITVIGPQPTLLAFLSSGCSTCAGFWDAFAGRVDVPGDEARLVIVTKGSDQESESAIAALAPPHHQLVMSSQAWEDYDVPVSPYFVLVEGDGAVAGEGAAMNWAQLSKLVNEATADRRMRSGFRARNARVDRELTAAGIEPGHPSLHGDIDDEGGTP